MAILQQFALPQRVPADAFSDLQRSCFLRLHDEIYAPFQLTPQLKDLSDRLHRKYNVVSPYDFDFLEKIGEGGYGFAVRCRKISTGIVYAMKIQRKRYVLSKFQDNMWKVALEKKVLASFQYSFIVPLEYAFQTDALAFMALELSTAGDLQHALHSSPLERLDEEWVRFYMAEVALALTYLHRRGFIYRDLKPSNSKCVFRGTVAACLFVC
jgi:serine/threonine protein kinase